jgi:hypothetical protein
MNDGIFLEVYSLPVDYYWDGFDVDLCPLIGNKIKKDE